VDALRELDDALPIIFLFAHLPQQGRFNVSNTNNIVDSNIDNLFCASQLKNLVATAVDILLKFQ